MAGAGEELPKRVAQMLSRAERRDRPTTTKLRRDTRVEQAVFEEVFDKPTLMTVYHLLNRGILGQLHGAVQAGKESRIYWAKSREGEDLAVKIYLTVSAEFRKGMVKYIEGDPRFEYPKGDVRSLVALWASKEYRNLKQAYEAGVRVPEPIHVERNVLVMEFIGEDGRPAALLKDSALRSPTRLYRQVMNAVRKLYRKAELVHGDLSEYNIMMRRGVPVLFDLSQAVSVKHPLASELLKRDISNLTRWFQKKGAEVMAEEEAYKWIVS
ncbi:MAG: serine protein kinase RIO [Candidatus Bathyarchaeia archaeon]